MALLHELHADGRDDPRDHPRRGHRRDAPAPDRAARRARGGRHGRAAGGGVVSAPRAEPDAGRRRAAHRLARPAHAAAARRAVRARDRDRHRLDGRRARHLGVLARRPARADRPARDEPAAGRARASRSSATRSSLPDAAGADARARRGRRGGRRRCARSTASPCAAPTSSTRPRPAASRSPPPTRRSPRPSAPSCAPGASSTPRSRATRRSCSAPTRRTSSGSRRPARASSSAGAGSRSRASSTPVALAPALDDSALVGFAAAERWLGGERDASTVYVRARPGRRRADPRDLLGATANPERPEEVDVSRPSDALEAQAAAKTAFTSLFLGLGAVALLVGGVGIANVMVISVLERRSEVGLRRALGARRRHVGAQFLVRVAAAGGGGRGRGRRARRGGHRRLRGAARAGRWSCRRRRWPAGWPRRC